MMSRHVAALLPCRKRLHLQHGPIDLVIGADGRSDPERGRVEAFSAAEGRFATILRELVAELDELRRGTDARSNGFISPVARRMFDATSPFSRDVFVTPMAAVAGAVADEVLSAMVDAADLRRAYVNNGGDIAIYLGGPRTTYRAAIASLDNSGIGSVELCGPNMTYGLATSGTGGRSLSLGIADSVTVLAPSAATADAAATLVANSVDLAGDHPAVERRPAVEIDPDSDLGERDVVTSCGRLCSHDIELALSRGEAHACAYQAKGLVTGAALFLQGQSRVVNMGLALT